MVERRWAPYRLPEFEIQAKRACLVYISSFTDNGIDIAYYIRQEDVTNFLAGTFGMQAYSGPVLLTPINLYSKETLMQCTETFSEPDEQLRVKKHEPGMEKVRWKYLYETGRLQWAKLVFDPSRWKTLKDRTPGASSGTKREYQEKLAITHREGPYKEEFGSIIKTDTRGALSFGEVEEPGRDRGGSPSEFMEDEEADSLEHIRKSGLHILQLLHSIEKKGGNPDSLLAHLSRRDEHANPTGVAELREKIMGLNDVMSLIKDYFNQERENKAAGIEMPNTFEETFQHHFQELDEFLADIKKLMGMPKDPRNDSPKIEKEGVAVQPCSPTLTQQHALMLAVMRGTDQSLGVSRRLLEKTDWNVEDAIKSWFDKSESKDYHSKKSLCGKVSGWVDETKTFAAAAAAAPQIVRAGPSGIGSRTEYTPEDLAADRARLERLIALENVPQNTQQDLQQNAQHDPGAGDVLNKEPRKLILKISFKPTCSPTDPVDLAGISTCPRQIPRPTSLSKRHFCENPQNSSSSDAETSSPKKRMLGKELTIREALSKTRTAVDRTKANSVNAEKDDTI